MVGVSGIVFFVLRALLALRTLGVATLAVFRLAPESIAHPSFQMSCCNARDGGGHQSGLALMHTARPRLMGCYFDARSSTAWSSLAREWPRRDQSQSQKHHGQGHGRKVQRRKNPNNIRSL
jgi:hypothetical protein